MTENAQQREPIGGAALEIAVRRTGRMSWKVMARWNLRRPHRKSSRLQRRRPSAPCDTSSPPQKRPLFTTYNTLRMRRNKSGRRNRNMSRVGVVFAGSRSFQPWLQPGLECRGAGAQRRDRYEPPAAPCDFLLMPRSTLFPYSCSLKSSNPVLEDVDISMYPVSVLLLPHVVLPSALLA